VLKGSWFGDNSSAVGYATDSNLTTNYYSKNAQCFIGVDLGSEFVAMLRKIEFVPNAQWAVAAPFLIGAVF